MQELTSLSASDSDALSWELHGAKATHTEILKLIRRIIPHISGEFKIHLEVLDDLVCEADSYVCEIIEQGLGYTVEE